MYSCILCGGGAKSMYDCIVFLIYVFILMFLKKYCWIFFFIKFCKKNMYNNLIYCKTWTQGPSAGRRSLQKQRSSKRCSFPNRISLVAEVVPTSTSALWWCHSKNTGNYFVNGSFWSISEFELPQTWLRCSCGGCTRPDNEIMQVQTKHGNLGRATFIHYPED